MAEVGSLRISLGLDSSEFVQGTRGINAQLKALQSEFKAMQAGAGRFDNSLEALRNRQDVLNRTMQVHRQKVEDLKRQYEESVRTTGENSEATLRLAAAYNNAVAAMRQTEDTLDLVNRRINEQTDRWQILQRRMSEVGESFRNVGERMKNVGQTLSTSLTVPLTALAGLATKTASDFETSNAKIQNSFGLTAEEAEKLGQIARDLYNRGFGESLDDIQNALIQTRHNIKGLTDEELANVITQAKVLGDTFDADVNEVTRAGNNLMKGFGVSADEAFNLMANGAQNGLNFSNEMFDNLSEYSTLFASMGFSAEEYFQLLQKGSQAGVYNLDYINDIMKELQIRVKDGSKATSDAMALLSSETNKVWESFLDGESTVKDVHNAIISELSGMEDQVLANQIAVGLYGTKFEDLEAQAVYALGGIDGELGNIEGKMQNMVEVQEETFGQRFQGLLRETQTALLPLGTIFLELAEQWLPKISAAVQSISEWFANLSPTMQNVVLAFGAFTAVIGPLLMIIGSIASGIGTLISLFGTVSGAIASAGGASAALGSVLTALTGPIGITVAAITGLIAIGVSLYKNNEQVRDMIQKAWEAIKQAFSTALTFISNIVKTVMSEVQRVFGDILGKISAFWKENGDQIMSIISAVMKFVGNLIQRDMQFIKGIFEAVWPIISGVVKIAWGVIEATTKSVVDFILGTIQVFLRIFEGDWKGAFEAVKGITVNIMNNIVETFKGIDLVQIGKDIIQGLINGIGSMASALGNKVKDMANGAVNAIKSTLGIHSPSLVFKGIGEFMMDGLILGVDEKIPEVEGAMDKVVEAVTNKAASFVKAAVNLGKSFSNSLSSSLSYSNDYVASTALPGSSSNTLAKGPDGKYYTWEDYNEKFQSGSSGGSSSGGSKLGNAIKDTVGKVKDSLGKIFKFHDGGWVGLQSNEIPAILQKGEFVLSREMIDNMLSRSSHSVGGNTDNSRVINQNIVIHSPQPISASETARKYKQASRQLAMEW